MRKDLPCSECGVMMYRSRTSAPEGEATCRPCRRARPTYRLDKRLGKGTALTEYDCGACGIRVTRPPTKGQRPKWCADCRRTQARKRINCEWCGVECWTWREGRFCSLLCYSATRSDPICELPATHPVMLLLYPPTPKAEPAPKCRPYVWQVPRECPGCACQFVPLYTPNAICCSPKCQRRMHRLRRRAREAGAIGSWRWSDFMRIAAKFDYCCAYCGVKPDRLDPDHVVPLSRGGHDSPSNLLPTCILCNSDKCDKTLDEWATWRAERGKEPRITNWAFEDKRYHHLTQVLLAAG